MSATETELQETLRLGRPLLFPPPPTDGRELKSARARRTIQAAWLEALANESGQLECPVTVAHAVVDGPLNLSHLCAERPFAITDSEFTGPVTCEFAVFTHGLQLDGAHFYQAASFRGIEVTGDLSLQNVVFNQVATLEDLHVTKVLTARGVSAFAGFNAQRLVVDKDVNFTGATFSRDAHFNNARFGGVARFDGAHFRGEATFNETQFEGTVYFGFANGVPVVHEGTADFGDARLCLPTFDGTQFRGEALFFRATINGLCQFKGATFCDVATFNRARIDGDCFFFTDDAGHPVRFAKNVDFSAVRIAGLVEFFGTRFDGDARFYQATIGGGCRFHPDGSHSAVRFAQRANFSFCRINGATQFVSTLFEDEATFHSATLGGCIFDRDDKSDSPVRFARRASFSFCQIAWHAGFADVNFEREADFSYSQITGYADFSHTQFGGTAVFTGARVGADARFQHATFLDTVDLRGLMYADTDFAWRDLFARFHTYDRQPYAQLEATLRRAGDDRAADDVYYARRRAEAAERWPPRSLRDALWVLGDQFYWLVAGYGVRPVRFVVWALVLLGLGWWLYRQPNAVVRVRAEQPARTGGAVTLDGLGAFWVSLDQLLPITIPGGSTFAPSAHPWVEIGGWSLAYIDFATLQTVLGWVLIPAGLGIIAAGLRRQASAGRQGM